MNSVGVVGYRSWIGQALMDRIQEATPHRIVMLEKRDADSWDSSKWLALFVIPGRVTQTVSEMLEERELVFKIANSRSTCKRQILLGSQSVFTEPDSSYGHHKRMVDQSFLEGAAMRRAWAGHADMRSIIVRPGAVFGPTQDPGSPMLIPSIAREGDALQLKEPDRPTKFISVGDLTAYLVSLIEGEPPTWWQTGDVPGTFVATPHQVRELWRTFSYLRAANQPDE